MWLDPHGWLVRAIHLRPSSLHLALCAMAHAPMPCFLLLLPPPPLRPPRRLAATMSMSMGPSASHASASGPRGSLSHRRHANSSIFFSLGAQLPPMAEAGEGGAAVAAGGSSAKGAVLRVQYRQLRLGRAAAALPELELLQPLARPLHCYAHGGFMGAALSMMSDPQWTTLLMEIEDEDKVGRYVPCSPARVCARARRASCLPACLPACLWEPCKCHRLERAVLACMLACMHASLDASSSSSLHIFKRSHAHMAFPAAG